MKNNVDANHQAGTPSDSATRLVSATSRPFIRMELPPVCARGVTLIELMAVLVVTVILMGIAVPAIGDFVRNARMTTQTNEFVADLAFSRSEAIKRAANVVICKSSNPAASPPSCNTTGDDWSGGWIAFVDDQTENNTLDAGEEVLRTHAALESNNTLFSAAGVANSITYTRNGLSILSATSSFVLCDQRGAARGRSITLEVTGRPTIGRNPSSCDPA